MFPFPPGSTTEELIVSIHFTTVGTLGPPAHPGQAQKRRPTPSDRAQRPRPLTPTSPPTPRSDVSPVDRNLLLVCVNRRKTYTGENVDSVTIGEVGIHLQGKPVTSASTRRRQLSFPTRFTPINLFLDVMRFRRSALSSP